VAPLGVLRPPLTIQLLPPVDNPLVRTRIGVVARVLSMPGSRRRRKSEPRWADAEGERTARRGLYGERQAIDTAAPRPAVGSSLIGRTPT